MDTIVIGGGIAGLYAALDNPRTLVLEASDHLGGRICTHTKSPPQYEIGAGRIHARHKLVRGLIHRFGLTEIPLPVSATDTELLRVLPLERTEDMRQMTYAQFCRRSMSRAQVEALRQAFGYYSEFEVMNAYDAVDMLRRALSGKFFIVKEGLSELVRRMAEHVNYNSTIKCVSCGPRATTA